MAITLIEDLKFVPMDARPAKKMRFRFSVRLDVDSELHDADSSQCKRMDVWAGSYYL